MNCRVIFDNGNPDGRFAANGGLTVTDGGFSLVYTLDGDGCTLTYSDGCLMQKRSGGAPLEVTFREGEETVCTLEVGGLCGELPVFTEKLDVKTTADGVKIYLAYSLGGEKTVLNVTAAAV